jgi:hypothetical protein
LGLLAGSRTAVRATNALGTGIRVGFDNAIPREIRQRMELDKMHKNQDFLEGYGYVGNPTDAAEVNGFKGAIFAVRQGLIAGREGVESFLNSDWVQSQFSFLKGLEKYSTVPKKMANFLYDISNQIKFMKGDLAVRYNAKHGSGAFETFLSTKGYEIAQPLLKRIMENAKMNPEGFTKERVIQELNEAVYRIIDTGKGTDTPISRAGAADSYANKPWVAAFEDELLRNDGMAEYINAYRQWFERANREHFTQTDRMINNAVTEIKDILRNGDTKSEYARIYNQNLEKLVDDFRASKMTWKQYSDSISGDPELSRISAKVTAALKGDGDNRVGNLFERVRQLQSQINGQERMHGAYVPHMHDRNKMNALKQRLIKNEAIRPDGVGGPDDIKGLKTFDEWVEDRTFELNYGNDRKLYTEDGNLLDYEVRAFSSQSQGKNWVKNHLNNLRADDKITVEQYRQAMNKLDDFVVKGKRANEKGTLSDYFYLESPSALEFNPFDEPNRSAFKTFSSNYRDKDFDLKKSSHIDYQRKVDIPYELRMTDMEGLTTRYANDVAPRLHSYRHNIFNMEDFKREWVVPLEKDLADSNMVQDISAIGDRLAGIYNTSMRVNKFKTETDMRNFEKRAKFANTFRNVMASAYQYGIGFYNLFEHAVQTPTLTSWDAYTNTLRVFAGNADAANAMAETILDFKVIEKQLKSQGGNYAYFEDLSEFGRLGRGAEDFADFSANFSISKYLGRGVGLGKGWEEKTGLYRIAFDGFMGGNVMSTALNAHATLYELRKLTEVYQALKNIQPGEVQSVRMHGQRYNMGEIERKLANLGINESNLDGYMSENTQRFLKDFMENIEMGRRLSVDEIDQNASGLSYLNTVLNHTTENYQATNQFFRPEKAMTPNGRLLYQYSTYSYNQMLQNYQRRFRFPIDQWTNSLRPDQQEFSVLKVLYHYNKGDFDALRNMHFTNEQISSFPAEAYSQAVKFFGAAVGMSVLGHTSLDALRDIVAYPFKDDDDQWRRLKRRTVLNPLANKQDQVSFLDFDDVTDVVFKLPMFILGTAIDAGLFGRLDALYSSYEKRSLLDLTPITRASNEVFQDVNRSINSAISLDGFPDTMSDIALRNALKWSPVIGSSVFSEAKREVRNWERTPPARTRGSLLPNPNLPQLSLP